MTTPTVVPLHGPWRAALSGVAPRAPVRTSRHCDVVVVGAGTIGLTTALLLAREGIRVVVLEADRMGGTIGGARAGAVTSADGPVHAERERRLGSDAARTAAAAQQAALVWMRDLVRTSRMNCDWRDVSVATVTADPAHVEDVRREADATRRVGLPVAAASRAPQTLHPLAGFGVTGQATFHPVRYLLGLACEIERLGVAVHEHSRVVGVHEADRCTVTLDDGVTVTCSHVVVAAGAAVLGPDARTSRLGVDRPHAVAFDAPAHGSPDGPLVDVGAVTRSVQRVAGPDGDLLVAGSAAESEDDTPEALEAWVRERFDVGEVRHRWVADALRPWDGIPYVGHARPLSRRLWVAAAPAAGAVTGGTAAAMVLAHRVRGRTHPWAALFDAHRLDTPTPGRFVRGAAGPAPRHRPTAVEWSAGDAGPGA